MTEVVIKSAKPAEDPAHIEAMVAKAEGREPEAKSPEGDTPERPAWLPEGFNTPEELAAAYAAATKKPDAAPADNADANAAAADAVKAAGLDLATLEAKVLESGTLEDADYAALEKAGIPRAMADAYIEGQKALGEALTARVQGHVGGKEVFDQMVSWAAAGGITAAEAEAFNSVIDSGSEEQIKLALDGLKSKFVASGRNTPALIGGGRSGGATDVYESLPQMMEDMRDPRYAKDPAFRAAVEAKLSRSSIM
jgi:hypothetical protein